MRLLSVEVDGFRGFASKQYFDLAADAVILVGANGNGKTSLFDAILWGIAGRVPRLGIDDSLLTCRFSQTGRMRVVVRLGGSDRDVALTVTRVFDGTGTRISVETPDGILHGPEAEGRLIQRLWKEAATAANPLESLAVALTRSVYLQQDLVRDFIEAVTAQDRFSAVSELVGAGRVTDLQRDLERAKKAWSLGINTKSIELQPLRDRLVTMQSRLNELKGRLRPTQVNLDQIAWNNWWDQMKSLGIELTRVPIESRESAGAIDLAIRQLDSLNRAAERRNSLLDNLSQDLQSLTAQAKPDLTQLRTKIVSLQQQVQQARAEVSAEQKHAAEVRRMQTELSEKSEQLKTLAQLALKHLGDKCPVCNQQYDHDATRRRLDSIVTGAGDVLAISPASQDRMPTLLRSLASYETQLSGAEVDLRTAEQRIRDIENTERSVGNSFRELGIEAGSAAEQRSLLTAARTATKKTIDDLAAAQKAGEAFARQLSQTRDLTTIQELEREITLTRSRLQQEDTQLTQRAATGDQAQRVIEALREAASRVVTEQIEKIEPLLADIYSRIDMHPAFRVVRFLTSVVRGRGQLSAVVSDPLSQVEFDSPSAVLSSSQMNALAVCAFLSINLGVSDPPLESAILDDPLQSLDDINLLGLIDLLRRTKDRRQLFVSTHDARFGNLLQHKLRPGSHEQRTVVIELNDWSRTGPTVVARDLVSDPVPIRLAAAS